ncbi:MAG: hypothetical protein M3464_09170 [Chloroflexota bacterium]|nr:hypothetical protein [Chloroflexota bacterium]
MWSKDELDGLQDPEAWDEGEVRPPVKSPRAIVSVAFAREDFERIAEYATRRGMKTSEFIRRAALETVVPRRHEPAMIIVTGSVHTVHPAMESPRPKIEVTTSRPSLVFAMA